MPKQQSSTYATGKNYKTKPKPFQGRSEDPANTVYQIDDILKNQYSNTIIERGFHGDLKINCFAKDYEYVEERHPSGTGYQVLPDGSRHERTTGFTSSYSKHSETKTVHGNSDGKTEGQERTNVKGGSFSTVAGNKATFIGGVKSEAVAEASGHSGYHIGKYTKNAEGGIGFGVNKGADQHIWMRLEPTGHFILQVKPQGQSSGNAVVIIEPSGKITIESKNDIEMKTEQKLTIKSEQKITLKSPQMKINSSIEVDEYTS